MANGGAWQSHTCDEVSPSDAQAARDGACGGGGRSFFRRLARNLILSLMMDVHVPINITFDLSPPPDADTTSTSDPIFTSPFHLGSFVRRMRIRCGGRPCLRSYRIWRKPTLKIWLIFLEARNLSTVSGYSGSKHTFMDP
ncbi:uncharacterized protein LOC127244990 [Andrographis paniculata]|uniref:uncharacterized protein LOC127244990 n=1 Tax=Andrographis paniculata TaxID=175694 RepID=UPI0021E8811B|nr:uncharacterized protein LOC127244990 [Andrographis paniculata]